MFYYIIDLEGVAIIWKRVLLGIDYILLLIVFALIGIGLVMISSATHNYSLFQPNLYLARQIAAAVLGFIAMMLALFFDYRRLKNYAELIYIGSIVMLVMVIFFGRTVSGGQRWFYFGPINFQPSELAKIAIIISLAALLSSKDLELDCWSDFIYPFLYLSLPAVLVFVQNDLGTALVFGFIMLGMLFLAGANLKLLLGFVGGGLASIILWIFLHLQFGLAIPFKHYQLMRLIVFLDPSLDPQNYGYNIIQSQIAIGSGGLYGKGLFSGTQTRLNFLPEQHTDFIFSVVAEELGFIGSMVVLFLFFLLLWKGIEIISQAKDRFGILIAGGVVFMFTFHILENIGMTIGMMPITGIPLPFLSYGGSSLLTNMLAIGLLLNIKMRRQKLSF